MIVPFLDGFLTFSRVPVTWILIMVNAFLFSQNYSLSQDCQKELQSWYQDSDYLYTQGQVYRQFSRRRDVAQVKDMKTLGTLAFRDEAFMTQAPKKDWQGDQVAIATWKDQLDQFMVLRAYYPPLIFGVSTAQKDFFSTISYQFYNEGFAHLLGNILFILIFGGYLERRYSGLTVFAVYLIGGSLAALTFIKLGYISGAPLVGASGSLCALSGFLCVTEFKTKTRLFYIALPSWKYMGFVSIPTVYWIVGIWMIGDIAGFLAQPNLVSTGVAYAIHLAGFAVGAMMAIVYRALNLHSLPLESDTHSEIFHNPSSN